MGESLERERVVPAPKRLLVRGVNWLGDAVMSTPALLHLRRVLPEARITLLSRAKLADLWAAHPAVDEVLCIAPGDGVWAVGRMLRPHGFDTALVLPNSPRSALEVFLGGIPRRIGYRRAWRNWLLTEARPLRPGHVRMRKRTPDEIRQLVAGGDHVVTPPVRASVPREAHQVYDYLGLAGVFGPVHDVLAPRLCVSQEEMRTARERFDMAVDLHWLGVNAGAEYGPAKRWPPERFVEVVKAVQARARCGVVVFGGPGDKAIAEELTARLRGAAPVLRDVAGRTSLRELMSLLACCRVLLTNDTGPMHLAAALGTPVVVPFGSTSPELTGPGLPGDPRHQWIRSNAPCSPCFLRECPIDFRCMTQISVEAVQEAVHDALADNVPR